MSNEEYLAIMADISALTAIAYREGLNRGRGDTDEAARNEKMRDSLYSLIAAGIAVKVHGENPYTPKKGMVA